MSQNISSQTSIEDSSTDPLVSTAAKVQWMQAITHAVDEADFATQVVNIFNQSPFLSHNGMCFRYENNDITMYFEHQPKLVGNLTFGSLHGGVAATILDSMGGVATMLALYRQQRGSFADIIKKVDRVATLDLRIDYLAPGQGQRFTATGEVLRLGNKGSMTRMTMKNEAQTVLAVGVASFSF